MISDADVAKNCQYIINVIRTLSLLEAKISIVSEKMEMVNQINF